MSLIHKISRIKPARLLKIGRHSSDRQSSSDVESKIEDFDRDLSLESIKDMIIEAYGDVDKFRRTRLLEQAEHMESQLVAAYRLKGLEITADNIRDTLSRHRKRHHKRSF